MVEADMWFEPAVVIEILGAERTLSPIHTCAVNVVRKGSGLVIRFPRFTGNYRLDKAAEDATPIDEVVKKYKDQLKKIEEYRNMLLILKGPSLFSLLLSYKTS